MSLVSRHRCRDDQRQGVGRRRTGANGRARQRTAGDARPAARLGGAEPRRLVEGGDARDQARRRQAEDRRHRPVGPDALVGLPRRRQQGDPPGPALVRRADHRTVPRRSPRASTRLRCGPGSPTRRWRGSRCRRSSGCATTSRRPSRGSPRCCCRRTTFGCSSRGRWRPSTPTRRGRCCSTWPTGAGAARCSTPWSSLRRCSRRGRLDRGAGHRLGARRGGDRPHRRHADCGRRRGQRLRRRRCRRGGARRGGGQLGNLRDGRLSDRGAQGRSAGCAPTPSATPSPTPGT